MKKLLVVLLLLYPLSASAVTYEWTDAAGTVNFTEDLGNVPKKYRKKVKVLGAEESGTPQVIEEPVKVKPQGASPQKEKEPATKDDAATIRDEYAAAKADLRSSEQDLADLRARLGDTSKMYRTEYLSIQNTVKQNEFRIQEQKKKLEQLRSGAQKAGVNLDAK